jgi:hypothetical protein
MVCILRIWCRLLADGERRAKCSSGSSPCRLRQHYAMLARVSTDRCPGLPFLTECQPASRTTRLIRRTDTANWCELHPTGGANPVMHSTDNAVGGCRALRRGAASTFGVFTIAATPAPVTASPTTDLVEV